MPATPAWRALPGNAGHDQKPDSSSAPGPRVEPPAQRLQRLQRFYTLGTIDLRGDYLRPGISDHFELRAEVLRLGSRVASTRMEFLGADGKLFSTAAACIVS